MKACLDAGTDDDYCQFVKVKTLLFVADLILAQDHFNYLVTHNAMKWSKCERREGVFTYEEADGKYY